jgi:dephospho-CoA kinase
MLWVGLTGGIGSGKSTVSRLLRERGYTVVDADVLAREVAQAGTPAHSEIEAAFGRDVITDSGELDRKKLGAIVFADPTKRDLLEKIIHPRVRLLALEKRKALEAEGRSIAFYDVPLLFEKNMQDLFDEIVVVHCAPDLQLKRLMARDGSTKEAAEARIKAQMPLKDKVTLADVAIANDGDLAGLEREVDRALGTLTKAKQNR